MKQITIFFITLCPVLTVFGQGAGFKLDGLGSTTLPVTLNKMTNIVFPAPIRSAVKVSRDVLAQRVRGVDNVIELKAMRRAFAPTNLSVYGVDGHLYSFVLKYVDDTSVLNYRVVFSHEDADIHLTGLPFDGDQLRADAAELARGRRFLRTAIRSGRLRFALQGIWLRDSVQWFVFELDNRSFVMFRPVRLRFYMKDAARVNRRAAQEQELHPVYTGEVHDLPGRRRERFSVAFAPFTVPRGKWLIVQLKGQDGRMLVLKIRPRMVLRARAE